MVGGFIQVVAHGTGQTVAPVDHYVTKMKLVTLRLGTLTLSAGDVDPELFQLAKVGLGCLGIVVEITMQCIPAHRLVEHLLFDTSTGPRSTQRAFAKTQAHAIHVDTLYQYSGGCHQRSGREF